MVQASTKTLCTRALGWRARYPGRAEPAHGAVAQRGGTDRRLAERGRRGHRGARGACRTRDRERPADRLLSLTPPDGRIVAVDFGQRQVRVAVAETLSCAI